MIKRRRSLYAQQLAHHCFLLLSTFFSSIILLLAGWLENDTGMAVLERGDLVVVP